MSNSSTATVAKAIWSFFLHLTIQNMRNTMESSNTHVTHSYIMLHCLYPSLSPEDCPRVSIASLLPTRFDLTLPSALHLSGECGDGLVHGLDGRIGRISSHRRSAPSTIQQAHRETSGVLRKLLVNLFPCSFYFSFSSNFWNSRLDGCISSCSSLHLNISPSWAVPLHFHSSTFRIPMPSSSRYSPSSSRLPRPVLRSVFPFHISSISLHPSTDRSAVTPGSHRWRRKCAVADPHRWDPRRRSGGRARRMRARTTGRRPLSGDWHARIVRITIDTSDQKQNTLPKGPQGGHWMLLIGSVR